MRGPILTERPFWTKIYEIARGLSLVSGMQQLCEMSHRVERVSMLRPEHSIAGLKYVRPQLHDFPV